MTDALDDLIAADDEEPSRPGSRDEQLADNLARGQETLDAPGTFVCDEIVDGEVCGKTFGTRRALSGHTSMKHRERPGRRKKTGTAAPPKAKAKAPPKAPPPPSDPTGIRADMYGSSLVMAATLVYLAAGERFDAYDLNVVTKGAPGWGAALDAVGERHAAVRAAADAILGGAGGVIYFQLLVSTGIMVLPILAHHGIIPAEVGERFADMLGVMLSPAPPAPPAPPSDADAGGEAAPPPPPPYIPSEGVPSPDPENWTLDEWQSVLFRMPPRVMSDIMAAQGIGTVSGPTVIDVPNFSTAGADNGATGTDDTATDAGDTVPAS